MSSEFTSQVVMKFLLAQFWKEVKDRPAQTLKCGFCGCVALSKSSSYIFVLQAFTSFVLDCKTATCNYVLTTCYTIDLIAITLSSKINWQSQTGIKLSMHITFWYSDNLEHTFAVTLHKLSWEKFTILLLQTVTEIKSCILFFRPDSWMWWACLVYSNCDFSSFFSKTMLSQLGVYNI